MSVRRVHIDTGPSCREYRKGENLKLGTCISAVFSQIFHRNRALGSPRPHLPDCLKISPENNKENEIWLQTMNVALKDTQGELQAARGCVTTGHWTPGYVSSVVIRDGEESSEGFSQELRHLLGAKQEPFVLQDAIREKRQPVRIKSSHGLKDPRLKEEKRRSRKRSNPGHNSDEIKVSDACGSSAMTKIEEINAVSASVSNSPRRSRAPPERMVAIPSSNQAYAHVASLKKNSTSPASKNSGKRALLMEAASKILEGGSNRSRRHPAASVRSLLSEVEGGGKKKAQGSMRRKTTAMDSQTETKKKRRKKNGAQIKTEGAALFRSLSRKINGGMGESERRSGGREKMEAENELLVSRMSLSGGEAVCNSGVKVADMAMRRGKEGGGGAVMKHGELEGPEFLKRRRERAVSSSSSELCLASSGESRRNSTSSSSITSSTPMSLSAQASPEHFQMQKLASSLNKDDDSSSIVVKTRPILQLEREVDHHSPLLSSSPSSASASPSINASCSRLDSENCKTPLVCDTALAEFGLNLIGAEKQTNIHRLCDFSWWEQREVHTQRASAAEADTDELENRRLQNGHPDAVCEECPSPTVVRGSLSAGIRYEAGRSSDGQSELSPPATNRPAVQEFKQSSPVSVLDPISDEEEESNNGYPLDSFEEAKQNLLENMRRFEMLAQLDLDTLMKLAEEDPASDMEEDCAETQQLSQDSDRFEEIYNDDEGDGDDESSTYIFSRKAHRRRIESGHGELYTRRGRVNLQILDLMERFRERARSSNWHEDSCRQIKTRIYSWPAVPGEVMQELGRTAVSSWLSAIDCKLQAEWGGGAMWARKKGGEDHSAEVEEWAGEMEVMLLASLVGEMVGEMMVGGE